MGQKIDLTTQVQGILPPENGGATPGTASLMFADNITPSGTINGVNTVFVLPNAPAPGDSLIVVIGHNFQIQGTDYTLLNNQITFAIAPVAGPIRTWFRWSQLSLVIRFERMTMADDIQTRFTTLVPLADTMPAMTESFGFGNRPSELRLVSESLQIFDFVNLVEGMNKKLSDTMTLHDSYSQSLL